MEECSIIFDTADPVAGEALLESHEQSETMARRWLFPRDYKYVSKMSEKCQLGLP